MLIISNFPVCEICFLCSVMTHNDIHFIICGSHVLDGSCMRGYSKHFFCIDTVIYLHRKLLYLWWKQKKKKILYLPTEWFRPSWASYYAPRRISGEHIVAASSVRPCVPASVRPCVRPALVHANSRKLLVGFQWNFMGILSIKGGCAYHLRVLVRWFFQELLPFDEFCMNI